MVVVHGYVVLEIHLDPQDGLEHFCNYEIRTSLSGLVFIVFALRMEGWDSIPGGVILRILIIPMPPIWRAAPGGWIVESKIEKRWNQKYI